MTTMYDDYSENNPLGSTAEAYDIESEKKMLTEDQPEQGKVYALTGATGAPSIANGNTWKESEVKTYD